LVRRASAAAILSQVTAAIARTFWPVIDGESPLIPIPIRAVVARRRYDRRRPRD
jgi:hypothetical protein